MAGWDFVCSLIGQADSAEHQDCLLYIRRGRNRVERGAEGKVSGGIAARTVLA